MAMAVELELEAQRPHLAICSGKLKRALKDLVSGTLAGGRWLRGGGAMRDSCWGSLALLLHAPPSRSPLGSSSPQAT